MHTSKVELAQILGLKNKGVQYWLDEPDLPKGVKVGRGNAMKYDLAVFLPWYIGRQIKREAAKLAAHSRMNLSGDVPSKEESEAIAAHYKALQVKMETHRMAGETITVEEATNQMNFRLSQVKGLIDMIPAQWAGRLLGVPDPSQQAERLKQLVDDMLTSLQAAPDTEEEAEGYNPPDESE